MRKTKPIDSKGSRSYLNFESIVIQIDSDSRVGIQICNKATAHLKWDRDRNRIAVSSIAGLNPKPHYHKPSALITFRDRHS